jgi:hypothetical protein
MKTYVVVVGKLHYPSVRCYNSVIANLAFGFHAPANRTVKTASRVVQDNACHFFQSAYSAIGGKACHYNFLVKIIGIPSTSKNIAPKKSIHLSVVAKNSGSMSINHHIIMQKFMRK